MSRRSWAVALAAYSLFLAVVLLAPTSGAQSDSVAAFADVARRLGVPDALTTASRAEFVANALILMPVSALGSFVWPSTRWRDWTAWAFVISGTVELLQGLFLPERSATFVDVVANTLGGLGGALAVAIWRHVTERRARAARARS